MQVQAVWPTTRGLGPFKAAVAYHNGRGSIELTVLPGLYTSEEKALIPAKKLADQINNRVVKLLQKVAR